MAKAAADLSAYTEPNMAKSWVWKQASPNPKREKKYKNQLNIKQPII